MGLEDHPYVAGYLLGCMFAFLFYIFQVVVLSCLSWITKANIIRKNLNKIKARDTSSITDKILTYGLMILLNVALSWIGVVMTIWQILVIIFNTARELFTSTPEEIKLLRFPIKNNPNLSREAVWAYVVALNLKNGTEWNEWDLRNELNNLADDYPTFNRHSAITALEGLKLVNLDSTKWLADRLNIRIDG